MGKYVITDECVNTANHNNNIYLDIAPKTSHTKQLTVRLVGLPYVYMAALPYRKSEDGTYKQCAFHDNNNNKSYIRICNDDLSNDYWAQAGYKLQQRCAYKCISRLDGNLYILTRCIKFFDPVHTQEMVNKDYNIVNNTNLWECAGGEIAPDLVIIGKKTGNRIIDVTYSLQFMPTPNKITEEEIEMMRSMYEPTPEELKKMKGDLDVPDWYFYGYNMDEIFKPSTPHIEVNGI